MKDKKLLSDCLTAMKVLRKITESLGLNMGEQAASELIRRIKKESIKIRIIT